MFLQWVNNGPVGDQCVSLCVCHFRYYSRTHEGTCVLHSAAWDLKCRLPEDRLQNAQVWPLGWAWHHSQISVLTHFGLNLGICGEIVSFSNLHWPDFHIVPLDHEPLVCVTVPCWGRVLSCFQFPVLLTSMCTAYLTPNTHLSTPRPRYSIPKINTHSWAALPGSPATL